jgi:hypothetical protein
MVIFERADVSRMRMRGDRSSWIGSIRMATPFCRFQMPFSYDRLVKRHLLLDNIVSIDTSGMSRPPFACYRSSSEDDVPSRRASSRQKPSLEQPPVSSSSSSSSSKAKQLKSIITLSL